MHRISLQSIGWTMVSMKLLLGAYLAWLIIPGLGGEERLWDLSILQYVLVGFLAQLVDGALGMAYGVSCTTFLLQLGVPPRVASASVHTAEVFTTGASGMAHLRFRNLDKPLFLKLAITGSIGSVLGAWLLADVLEGGWVRLAVAAYLLVMGTLILSKAVRKSVTADRPVRRAGWLGLIGGFLDATGGGGWGPIVTSHILGYGKDPRRTIGTVNTAEFFVTFFGTGVFLFFVGMESWRVVAGLVLGGVLAAPWGAWMASRLERRTMLVLIGTTVTLLSLMTLIRSL